jgi:plastocyanin
VTGASTITILGDRAAQSFTPNPGAGGVDQAVVWRNNDSVTHRIVVNDSTLDTGDIPPGGTSRQLVLPVAGANYHCSLHPGMIGAVTAAGGAPPPPCTGLYC